MHHSKNYAAQYFWQRATHLALLTGCALSALAGCSSESDPLSVGNQNDKAAASLTGGSVSKFETSPTPLAPNHLAQRPPSQPTVNPAETDHLPLWPPTGSSGSPATPPPPPLFPANPPTAAEQPSTEFTPPAFTPPQFEPAVPAAPTAPTAPIATAPSDDNPLRSDVPLTAPGNVPSPAPFIPAPPVPAFPAGSGTNENPLRLNAPNSFSPPASANPSPNLAAPTPENLLPSAPAAPANVPLAPSTTNVEPAGTPEASSTPGNEPAAEPVISETAPPLPAVPKPLPKIVNKAASRLPRVPTHPEAHAEWQAQQKLVAPPPPPPPATAPSSPNPSGGSANPSDYDPSAYGPAPQPRMMELGTKQDPPDAADAPVASDAPVAPLGEGSISGNGSPAVEIPEVPVFAPPTFDPAAPAAAPAAPLLDPPGTPGNEPAAAVPSFDPPELPAAPETSFAPAASEPQPPPAAEPQKTSALVPPASSNDPFDVIRVFYGTDRRAELVNRDTLVMRLIRFTPAAILIALSVVGVGVVLASRKISWIIGTSALLIFSTLAVWHGIKETLEIADLAAQEEPRYSADRSDRGRIERGICEVSIPKSHEPGEMETPSITRFEFEYNPADHITLRKTTRLQNDAFYEQLRKQVASSPNREILVFVHGFNVSFDDAARRTAQMASDLKLQGAPVFFSWPADKYFLLTYGKDETSVSWAAPHLKQFLLDLVHNTDARAINLVAHSMGNRALATALREIDLELRQESRLFNQVVLAAPDIDADDFRDNIAPAIQRTAKQVTLYASANDVALSASRLLHRNPRAGDTSQGLVLVPGVITIDVSNINGGPWGHSYYGASDPVLRDLHLLLTSLPPERRTWLNQKQLDGQTYWAFKPLHSASTPALVVPR